MKAFCLALLLLWASALPAQVIINEVSAANFSFLFDNYGEYEDWIELYNAGSQAVDLTGYHLSDDPDDPEKWTFPAGVTIGPHAHLIVFASDRDEVSGGFVHAGFKLTQTKQESVWLSAPDGSLLDAFEFPSPNQMNHSWGRQTDAALSWRIFPQPTPGGPNGGDSYAAYAPKPTLSKEAGFYEGPLLVYLDAPDGAQIRYTLDGSEPTATSPLYTYPLMLTQTTVVKARTFHNGADELPSFVETNTYFIDEAFSVPVISIAGDDLPTLMNGTWIEPIGSLELFGESQQLLDEAWGEFNKHGNDSWVYPQRGIDYITRDQLGYASSLAHQIFPGKSRDRFQRLILKAAANDNYPFSFGGAHIRDAYVHTLSQKAGLALDERTWEPCILFVNGAYWGVYEIREKVDDPDFTRHYYDQGRKWIDFIKTWGSTWVEYGSWDDWYDLYDFIMTHDMSEPANYAFVQQHLEVESLVDYIIINVHTVCKDWLNWNTAWWRGRKPTGLKKRWRYTLWDLDATFGHYVNYTGIPDITPQADPCDIEELSDNSDPEGHIDLLMALFQNPDFHDLYINRYADLNNTWLSCDSMLALLDAMIARIAPEMPRHIERWGGSMEAWEGNVQTLRDFIVARCDLIDGGLADCYELEGPWPLTVHVVPEGMGHAVRINTVVPASWPWSGDYFGGTLQHLQALPAPGWQFSHYETDDPSLSPDPTSDSITLAMSGPATVTAVFVPEIPCPAPTALTIDTFAYSALVHWSSFGNAISHELRWRPLGAAEWEVVSQLGDSLELLFLEPCTTYELGIRAICATDLSSYVFTTFTTACPTTTAEPAALTTFTLSPNPFGRQAHVRFSLSENTPVQLTLFAPSGKMVWEWRQAQATAGSHDVLLEPPMPLPAGVYVLVLRTRDGQAVRKCVATGR